MRLIVKSGIPLEEALGIMSDEEDDADIAAILADISKKIGQGDPLQEAFRESGKFPDYMTDMITMGYSTGYLEEVFAQLARYYDRETRLRDSIRSAIAYPAVLFVMMVCVILILIIKVLPVFKSVFDQMGGNMSGMAAAIMNAGVLIKEHAAVSAAAAAALVVGLLLVAYKRHREGRITILMTRRLQRLEGSARFAAVMSMAVSSGLSINEAVDMAAGMDFDRDTHAAIVMIKDSMDRGDAFDDSLRESGLFSNIYNRMISLGAKSGNMDKVLEEVSEHMDRAVSEELDSLTGKIEPTMVIILSVITGIILLSVMLPLTDIMNTIG
jgi:type IV pilus assembly protein PilC